MMGKLSKEQLAEIRTWLLNGHMNTEHIRRHLGYLLDHIDALESERASDPVRRFLAHPGFLDITRHGACTGVAFNAWHDRPNSVAVVYRDGATPGEACAAALRALEGSDGNG